MHGFAGRWHGSAVGRRLEKSADKPSLKSILVLMAIAEFATSGLTGVGYAMPTSEQGWGSEQMGPSSRVLG